VRLGPAYEVRDLLRVAVAVESGFAFWGGGFRIGVRKERRLNLRLSLTGARGVKVEVRFLPPPVLEAA
jgi:hypothetical protein